MDQCVDAQNIEKYYPLVKRYCRKFKGLYPAYADEIESLALFELVNKAYLIDEDQYPETFLYLIVKRAVLSLLRGAFYREIRYNQPPISNSFKLLELKEYLNSLCRSQTEKDILLYLEHGYTQREISVLMDICLTDINGMIRRLREHVWQKYQES